jgi:hypothetical protein
LAENILDQFWSSVGQQIGQFLNNKLVNFVQQSGQFWTANFVDFGQIFGQQIGQFWTTNWSILDNKLVNFGQSLDKL